MSGARMAVFVVWGLAWGACKGSSGERPAELEQVPAERAAPEPRPEVVAPAAEDGEAPSAAQLPVAEDFQVEMATSIVKANYRGELDALEGELRAEGD